VYNIPPSILDSYRDRSFIIRSPDPAQLADCVAKVGSQGLTNVQLLALSGDPQALLAMEEPVPVDLTMVDVAREFPLLYHYTELLASYPVRVTIPASPGVGRAARLAMSLGFEVKLEVTQPEPDLARELTDLLEYYLHNPTVTGPIEFYHSLLFAFLDNSPATLWSIQEEDPAFNRYITDDGQAVLSGRLPSVELPEGDSSFLEDLKEELLHASAECSTCDFFLNCAGYFKAPDPHYGCDEVRKLLEALKDASVELMNDVKQSFRAAEIGKNGRSE